VPHTLTSILRDFDADGLPDDNDLDADGDGIPNSIEGEGDADGDGNPDSLDLDAAGDGLLDSEEGTTDLDGDGIANFLDWDCDGDGFGDAEETAANTDPLNSVDYPRSLLWVDFGYSGVETGASTLPFNTLGEASRAVDAQGVVNIRVGVSSETGAFAKPMKVEAIGGSVRVGLEF